MRAILLLLSLTLLASTLSADGCVPTTSLASVEAADHYVVADACAGCLVSVWVYQESNGLPGLQRGDHVVDDTCGGQIEADFRVTLLYAATPEL